MKKWQDWKIDEINKKDFPEQLKRIPNCPVKLFYRGEWNNKLFNKSVAVVGSRRISKYGIRIIEKIIPQLAMTKFTIISGFMYGADTLSHQVCTDFGGKTVAVLGGGLDVLVPPENNDLYTKILETGGLVISEYEPDFKPTLWSFPQRNRIVSGLSTRGVIVIEAGMKSGSLITARLGRQQGREIWAVPGPIDSITSEGCNWLISQNKAKMLLSAEQLTKVRTEQQQIIFQNQLSLKQKEILKVIDIEGATADEISRATKISITELLSELTLMAFDNIIEDQNGKYYRK